MTTTTNILLNVEILPLELKYHIFRFMESPLASVFKQSKFYKKRSAYKLLHEVSHYPGMCKRLVRREYYCIYRDTFAEFLTSFQIPVTPNDIFMQIPTEEEFDFDEMIDISIQDEDEVDLLHQWLVS